MTFLQALRKVRPMIESGQSNYICIALLNTGNGKYIKQIKDRLQGKYSYASWMMDFHPSTYGKMKKDDYLQGRLQWIDYMISQELKK